MEAGEALVEHDAERVDVGALVDRCAIRELLRRHVVRRAEERPLGRGFVLHRLLRELGDAEVEELHVIGSVVAHQEEVLGLEVAMHDAGLVGDGEARAGLPRDVETDLDGERGAALEQRVEGPPLEVLHQQVGLAIGQPARVDGVGDVRAVDLRRHRRLAEEALHDRRILGEVRVDHLEGAPVRGHLVAHLVDDTAPSAPQAGEDPQLPQHQVSGSQLHQGHPESP